MELTVKIITSISLNGPKILENTTPSILRTLLMIIFSGFSLIYGQSSNGLIVSEKDGSKIVHHLYIDLQASPNSNANSIEFEIPYDPNLVSNSPQYVVEIDPSWAQNGCMPYIKSVEVDPSRNIIRVTIADEYGVLQGSDRIGGVSIAIMAEIL